MRELSSISFVNAIKNIKDQRVATARRWDTYLPGIFIKKIEIRMQPKTVLSLFDGMSCGRLALERAGIPVADYRASEIEIRIKKWKERLKSLRRKV